MRDLAFNQAIGELDYILSQLIMFSMADLDTINRYTLKHHAEDMIGAAKKILSNMEKTAKGKMELKDSGTEAYGPVKLDDEVRRETA